MTIYRYVFGSEARPDWQALHRLLLDSFAFMEGRIDPPSSLHRLDPQGLAAKSRAETLILCLYGQTIAGCGFALPKGDALYLGKLAVGPAHRRRGILRRMVEIAGDIARDNGLVALELQTRVELVENHTTFAALGFVETGRTAHDGFDHPTSLTMRRPLV